MSLFFDEHIPAQRGEATVVSDTDAADQRIEHIRQSDNQRMLMDLAPVQLGGIALAPPPLMFLSDDHSQPFVLIA